MPDMHWIWNEDSQSTDTRVMIARVGIRPFRQGHIQELYPVNWKFEWKDKSKFLLIMIRISKAQFDKFDNGRALKLKFKEVDGGFLSEASVTKYINNAKFKTKEEFEKDGTMPKIELVYMPVNLAVDMKTQVEDAPKIWRDDIMPIASEGIPINGDTI